MDSLVNFGFTTLASGITATATTATVATGEGARLPSANFNVAIWDSSYSSMADAYYAGVLEIARVTTRTSDTLTFKLSGGVREAQEGTTALAHNTTGLTYNVAQVLTAAVLTDVNGFAFATLTALAGADVDSAADIVPVYDASALATKSMTFDAIRLAISSTTYRSVTFFLADIVGGAAKPSFLGSATSRVEFYVPFACTAIRIWGDRDEGAAGVMDSGVVAASIAANASLDVRHTLAAQGDNWQVYKGGVAIANADIEWDDQQTNMLIYCWVTLYE
jgi:hypothetical protein